VIALVVLAVALLAAAAAAVVFVAPMLSRTAPAAPLIGGGSLGFDTDSPGAPSTRIQSVEPSSTQPGTSTPSVTPSGTP
jgi:hypothetical protein